MYWTRNILQLLGSVIPSILLAIVLVVITASVVARSVFQVSFQSANELAIVAFSFAVWFGIIGAALSGQLIGVSFFINQVPSRWQRPVQLVAHLLVILISSKVIQAAYAQVSTSHFTRFLSLGWPKWIIPAGLMVAMIVFILVQLLAIYELFRKDQDTL